MPEKKQTKGGCAPSSGKLKIDRVKLVTEMARNRVLCKDIIARSGLSRVTVTNVRSGKSCTRATAIAIANAIGCEISAITEKGGEDEN